MCEPLQGLRVFSVSQLPGEVHVVERPAENGKVVGSTPTTGTDLFCLPAAPALKLRK